MAVPKAVSLVENLVGQTAVTKVVHLAALTAEHWAA